MCPTVAPPDKTTSLPPAWLTWFGLALALPASAFYLLVTGAIKLMQLRAVDDQASLWTFLQAWSADHTFALAAGLCATLLFSRLKGLQRLPFVILYGVALTYMLMMAVASHGYFLSTGANLSWSSIEYWLRNFKSASRVVASEGVFLRFAIAYSQPIVVLLALVIPQLKGPRRRLEAQAALSTRAGLSLGAVLGLAFIASLFIGPPHGPAMAVGRAAGANIIADFVEDELMPEAQVEIHATERLDSQLKVTRDPDAPRTNVVLIMFESLRWSSSDVYEPGLDTTPYLASLAKDSLTIDRQYTVVPHTTKAVTALNCGIYPYLDTEPKEATPGILPRRCLAHLLRAQGYKTAFFQTASYFEHRDKLVANMGYETFRGLPDMPGEGFEPVSYFGREDRMMVEPSLAWVDEARKDGPFLLTYLTLTTHHNYVYPQSFPAKDYAVEDHDLGNYLNAVRYTDDVIREIMEGFKARGILEDTLFLVIGDHGEAFGEHGGRQHDLIMWEEGLRSFGMIYAPKYLEPGHIEGLRSHLDIVPTVADFLGLELTEGDFVGSSLLKPAPAGRKLFHSCWFQRRCMAMSEGFMKTIYHYGLRASEVYDHQQDPLDTQDLYGTPGYGADVIKPHEEEMLRWVKVVNQQYREWGERLTAGAISAQAPEITGAMQARATRFGDLIELVAFELSPSALRAGEDLRIRTVFRVLERPKASLRLFMHVHQRGKMINADHVPVHGNMPLAKWKKGQYITDEQVVHIPGTWGTGEVTVSLGFWDRRTKKRLELTDDEASRNDKRDKRLTLGRVKVRALAKAPPMSVAKRREKAGASVSMEAPEVREADRKRAVFGGAIELLAVEQERMDVNLAGTVQMTYVFHSLKTVARNWKLRVSLVREVAEASPGRKKKSAPVTIDGDHAPIGGLYPLSDWRRGEYVRDQHRIHIDMNRSKPGTYGVYLGFTRGRAPVPVETSLPRDDTSRVRIGTVTISSKKDG